MDSYLAKPITAEALDRAVALVTGDLTEKGG
jgi:hypothetical protein